MKFLSNKNQINEALSQLINISVARGKEASRCLLIAIGKDNKLVLSTTNKQSEDDQYIIAYSKIKVKDPEQGQFLCEAKLFDSLIKKLPADTELKIFTNKKSLQVSTKKSNYTFDSINEEFIAPEAENYFWNISVKAETLLKMIEKSGWAYAVKDEEHPILEGVLFEFNKDEFSIVSGNGHKFANSTIKVNFTEEEHIVVPNKMIKILQLHLKKAKNVTMYIGEDQIQFKCDDIYYVCKLIKGKYPNIKSKSDINKHSIILKRTTFIKSVDRLIPFCDNVKKMLIFDFTGNDINLLSHNISNKLKSNELLESKWVYKNKFMIGTRGDLLSEILKHIKGIEEIELRFDGPNKPIKILEKQNNSDYYLLQNLRTD